MPVYEYVCEGCSCRFEQYREVKDRAKCQCPECGKPARKAFRPVGIVFKGSGFHVNDYPSSGRGEQVTEKTKPEGGNGKPESVAAVKSEKPQT